MIKENEAHMLLILEKWKLQEHNHTYTLKVCTLLKEFKGSKRSTMSWQVATQPYTWNILFDGCFDWVRSLAYTWKTDFCNTKPWNCLTQAFEVWNVKIWQWHEES